MRVSLLVREADTLVVLDLAVDGVFSHVFSHVLSHVYSERGKHVLTQRVHSRLPVFTF